MKDIKIFVGFAYKKTKDPYLLQLYENLKKENIRIFDFKEPLKIFSVDIIHLHWIEYYIVSKSKIKTFLKISFFIYLFLLIKFILRKKIIISLHNIQSHEEYHPKIEKIGFRIYLKYIADRIIVFNNWSKKELIRRYNVSEKKVAKVFPETFIGYYPNKVSKREARKKLKIPEKKIVALLFGSLWKYKGILDVIDYFKNNKIKNFILIIAGKPENDIIKKKLENLAEKNKENIKLKLGFIPDDELQYLFNASDIGFLPYKRTTNSAVLFLFGSFKRTVLAKKLPVFKEIIGKDAFYYERISELKEIIKNINKEKAKKMGERFYKKLKKNSWKKISKETKKIYISTLKNPSYF